jgi:thiaminase
MAMESDKVMFEIYREATYTGKYRVVYYTELNENNKEWEINKAMSGEHFYDGFIKNYGKDEAKDIIDSVLKRMNEGENLTPEDIEQALGQYAAAK